MIAKVKALITGHKKSAIFILVVIAIGAIWAYRNFKPVQDEISYMTQTVASGTLSAVVSGSGQVTVSQQIDLSPRTSGDIVYLGMTKGQAVKTATLLVQLDASEVLKSVRDAEANLASARLSLEKLLKPANELELLQSEHALAKAEETKEQAVNDLAESFEDSYNAITDAFLDFPDIMSDLDGTLYSYEIADGETGLALTNNKSALLNAIAYADYNEQEAMQSYLDNAESAYQDARRAYDLNLDHYSRSSRSSDKETIGILLDESLATAKLITDSIKKMTNMLDYWVDYRSQRNKRVYSQVLEYQSTLAANTSLANGQVSSLLNMVNAISAYKQSIIDADREIEEKNVSHNQLLAGEDELDIESQRIFFKQKENALADAKENLADYYVRAPFDGVVAETDVHLGDQVSTGTVLASLITTKQLAVISLNEVDIAQVALGQKVTLTFDAVEDFSLSGEVADIDTLGEVSSGVVGYDVTVAFDAQDERIKPGMSLSANIITDFKQDIIIVPNSALKSQGDIYYVEVMTDGLLQPQPVEIGLAGDLSTEIVSGLNVGDEIVTQTINGHSAATASIQASFGGGNNQNNEMRTMIRMIPK